MLEHMPGQINEQDEAFIGDISKGDPRRDNDQAALKKIALESYAAHLAKGGQRKSSTVWTGHDWNGVNVYFKTIHERDLEHNSLSKQFDLHRQFQQAGVRVPMLRGFIENSSGQELEPIEILAADAVIGRTLGEELQYRQENELSFTPNELQGIIDDASEQVKLAHAAKLYHRDLDLRNVMLDQNGNIVLLDFGRAKKVMAAEDDINVYKENVTRGGRAVTDGYVRDESFITQFARKVQDLGLLKRS